MSFGISWAKRRYSTVSQLKHCRWLPEADLGNQEGAPSSQEPISDQSSAALGYLLHSRRMANRRGSECLDGAPSAVSPEIPADSGSGSAELRDGSSGGEPIY